MHQDSWGLGIGVWSQGPGACAEEEELAVQARGAAPLWTPQLSFPHLHVPPSRAPHVTGGLRTRSTSACGRPSCPSSQAPRPVRPGEAGLGTRAAWLSPRGPSRAQGGRPRPPPDTHARTLSMSCPLCLALTPGWPSSISSHWPAGSPLLVTRPRPSQPWGEALCLVSGALTPVRTAGTCH